MLRAFWYIVKVGIFVAAVVWLAERPGTVRIDWMEYTFHIQMGFFLVLLLATILLAIFIYRVIQAVANIPRAWRRYRLITGREKGHRALALGLTAVAAGDVRAASFQALRAVKFLPHDKGMPLLLQAQAARLNGDEEEARRIFAQMLDNKDTAFLGVRGLLQGALEAKNHPKALDLARQGLKLYPRQKWVLRIVYDLEIRSRKWDEARKTLARAERAGAVLPAAARSDRAAMLMAEGEELLHSGLHAQAQQKFQAAHKIDPYFVPAVIVLARLYKQDGQRKKAARLVEKTWVKTDHAALAKLWPELIDESKGKDALALLKWAEKLMTIRPGSAEAHLLMAQAAMDASLWGEARSHVEKAEEFCPDARIYKLRAEIEKRSTHDDAEALFWLEKAEAAPQPRVWVCSETGRVYDDWHAIAEPHGSFNTIVWDLADGRNTTTLPLRISGGDALLEAPRA